MAIGKLVHGGVKKNLVAALDILPELVEIGSYVRIDGVKHLFYAQVTDLSYGTGIDPRFGEQPIQGRVSPNLARLINNSVLKPYAELMLTLSSDLDALKGTPPSPVVTLPPLHSPVFFAGEDDMERIFGRADSDSRWIIGYTRRQANPIALDLRKLVQRSSAIFGITGSGKSQLTRGILAGIIHLKAASTLVMDLHSDFTYDDRSKDGGIKSILPGLKTIFPTRVQSYGLGKGTTVRGHVPDHILEIDINTVIPADITALSEELRLTDNTATVLSGLWASFGREWLKSFLAMTRDDANTDEPPPKATSQSVATWAKKARVNTISAEALFSKLSRLQRLPYLVNHPVQDGVQTILQTLLKGQHVILSFGDHTNLLDYLFVSTYLARRINTVWTARADEYRSSEDVVEPQPLVIVIEEAHSFLNRTIADANVYGNIAKEMRKRYVSLLVVDQRPSGISDDIMSQLAARFSGALTDERDIEALIAGLPGKDALRRIISGLAPCGEMLVAGSWIVPMPVSIKTRWMDAQFVNEMKSSQSGEQQ